MVVGERLYSVGPFLLVPIPSSSIYFTALVKALSKCDPSPIERQRKSRYRSLALGAYRKVARGQGIEHLVMQPSEALDSDYTAKINVCGERRVRVWLAYDVVYASPGLYILPGLKCYSRKIGCHYVTDVVFIDDGQLSVRRVWKRFSGDTRSIIESIVPKEVLRALDEGVAVRRQGDIWLLPLRRPPRRPLRAASAEEVTLFGSHRLRALEVIVSLSPEGDVRAVYALDPVLEHREHGTLSAEGWYKVLWNKRWRSVRYDEAGRNIYVAGRPFALD